MEPTITKRLHISGLTPSISQGDLSQRLSTFGNVKSLDGLGALDGVGRPKKFAYATLEATPAKISRCLNILSGSTWKGAKLRIGEAKSDFRERIQAENEKYAAGAEPSRKKARWKYAPYQGTHAKDMSPVTLETAKRKGGWVVTPLGRVYRPLRMRPSRPLPSLASTRSSIVKKDLKGKGKDMRGKGSLKERKRIKKSDVRARRRKIDMMKFGSDYLKGRFLDNDVPLDVGDRGILPDILQHIVEESSEEEESDEEMVEDAHLEQESEEEGNEEVDAEEIGALSVQSTIAKTPISPPPAPQPEPRPTTASNITSSGINLDQEKKQSLDLLTSLFGSSAALDEDEDDWMGKESIDSDVDEADLTRSRVQLQASQNDIIDFEIVPRDDSRRNKKIDHVVFAKEVDVEMEDIQPEVQEKELPEKEPPALKAPQQAPAAPKLRDLFAPAEPEGVFSLLGHLNLEDDLELDEDVPFLTTQEAGDLVAESQVIEPQIISVPTTANPATISDSRQTRQVSQITLDPSQPLFFPLALLASHPTAANTSFVTNPDAKNRPKDLYDTLEARGWDWRTSGFYRTQTEDEIRQRWEDQKVGLTQGWKKRWREAGRRRRGKVGGREG